MAYQSASASYDGRYARAGEPVVCKYEDTISGGMIQVVYDNNGDDIHIYVLSQQGIRNMLSFVATASANDIDNMDNNSWTWPL